MVESNPGYAIWANQYDDFDNPMVALSAMAMQEWFPSLETARVLELGCGTGRNALFFTKAREYVGVDGSTEMLEIAHKRSLTNSRFELGDIRAPLPQGFGHFDIVLLCHPPIHCKSY